MQEMKVSVEEVNTVERKLTVQVSAQEVDKSLDGIYAKLKHQAKLKGFRPGKAPRSVLERYYGPQASAQAAEELVGGSYADALAESELEPLARPNFDFKPLVAGQDFSYTVTLDVRPDFDMDDSDYLGLELKEPDLELTEDELSEKLEALRDRQAVLVPLEEDRPSGTGDVVVVDYKSSVDGEPLEGGAADNAEIELGKGQVQEEIELVLLKTVPGDMVTTNVDYDDTAQNQAVRGKTVKFDLLVKAIKTKSLPELDDDFARAVSPEFETLAALKERIEKDTARMYQDQKNRALRTQVMDLIRNKGEFDLPQTLVEQEALEMVEGFKNQMRQQGLNLEETGIDDEKMKGDFRPQAEMKVRSGIVLGRIADMESIEVSDEDLDAELEKLSESTGQPAETVKEIYNKNNMMPQLTAQVLEEKTLQAIYAGANITKVDPEELAREQQATKAATQGAEQ